GLQIHAVGNIAVSFRRVAHERDLVARASEKSRERVAELVPGRIAPDGIIFRVLLRHWFAVIVAIENGLQHRRRGGAIQEAGKAGVPLSTASCIGKGGAACAEVLPHLGIFLRAMLSKSGARASTRNGTCLNR